MVEVSAGFHQSDTQKAGAHENLNSGRGCMREKDTAVWQALVEGHISLLLIQAWEILFELDDLPKAKHYLELVLMILRVRLGALLAMVGTKHEKKKE